MLKSTLYFNLYCDVVATYQSKQAQEEGYANTTALLLTPQLSHLHANGATSREQREYTAPLDQWGWRDGHKENTRQPLRAGKQCC